MLCSSVRSLTGAGRRLLSSSGYRSGKPKQLLSPGLYKSRTLTQWPSCSSKEHLLGLPSQRRTDILVLGCGVAGCSTALKAAEQGLQVTVVTTAPNPLDCNSFWAQGGIIYKAEDDHPALLSSDILLAGAGINDPAAVRKLASEGPACVEEMLLHNVQVPFDRKPDGSLALCLEASHNRPRIIHWRDHTGRAITESLQKAVAKHPNILLLSGVTAIDLATTAYHCPQRTCLGAYLLPPGPNAKPFLLRSQATVVATGGLGDIYQHTSNPESAKGDGLAMTYRAGAAMQNMEYVQFHPTTLYLPGERSFLLTEALRGEGARLLNLSGHAFAREYHPQGELAPRDIVSRMIVSEMKRTRTTHVLLDISHRPANWLKSRFPSIYTHCKSRNLDLTKNPLPVVPAAHYFCGGIATDLRGRTSLPGLYAAGEVACTGLHGANRLASTSLLEGLVWGISIANHLAGQPMRSRQDFTTSMPVAPMTHPGYGAPADPTYVRSCLARLRQTMWEGVGLVRTTSGLTEALEELRDMSRDVDSWYRTVELSKEVVQVRNMVEVGRLIARAAARNERSLGTHFIEEAVEEEDEEEEMALAVGGMGAGCQIL